MRKPTPLEIKAREASLALNKAINSKTLANFNKMQKKLKQAHKLRITP